MRRTPFNVVLLVHFVLRVTILTLPSLFHSALFDTPGIATQMEDSLSLSSDDTESESGARSPCSPDAGIVFPSLSSCHALSPCSSLLGMWKEPVMTQYSVRLADKNYSYFHREL